MFNYILRSAILLFIALSASLVIAQGASHGSPPITFNAKDATLEWGPCPEFIPQGCEIAVLQGDPAKPNADIFFKVPAEFEVPHHWHTSAERMVLVSGSMRVEFDGGKSVDLRPGTYAYAPARHPHTAYCKAGAECVLFIAFEEPVDAHPVEEG